MTQKLYTLREIADILSVPRETFRDWTRSKPDSPTWVYSPPKPFAVTGANRMFLWTEDQLAEMQKELPRIQERRRELRVKHTAAAREARLRRHAQKVRKQEKLLKELRKTELDLEKIEAEKFAKERAERALQFLLQKSQ